MEHWWIGQRAIDCIGLDRALPIDAIISCDHGQESPLIELRTGATICSLEKATSLRRPWSNYDIEEAVQYSLRSNDLRQRMFVDRVVAIAYRSSPALESVELATSHKFRIAAAHTSIVQILDDKFTSFHQLAEWGVTLPRGEVCKLTETTFQGLARKYGRHLVIKQRVGASGTGTHFASTQDEFDVLLQRLGETDVLVTEFIDGPSYNIHGVVANSTSVVTSAPSVQLTGIPVCTDRASVYCGNDFSAFEMIDQDHAIRQAMRREMERIGAWLASYGYHGIFGVDFIGTAKHVVALDVNPRFQGSTSLLTQAEILRGQLPTAVLHLLQFVNAESIKSVSAMGSHSSEPIAGAQIILHSLLRGKAVVTRTIRPGVYWLSADLGLTYLRAGLSLEDCHSADEFVITCGIPAVGTLVEPGASLVKIIARGPVAEPYTSNLAEHASRVATSVLSYIGLEQSFGSLNS